MNKALGCLWLALLGCTAAGAAERLSNGFTQPADAVFRAGFWWDRTDPGWGLDLHLSGDSLVGIWATYDDDGNPTWYLGVGSLEGEEWVMPMTRYRWDGTRAHADGAAGELRLIFADGYHARMVSTLDQKHSETNIEPFIVDEQPVYADRTGFWYEPAQPGYGLSVSTQGPLLMSVFYFYDAEGLPRWAWADSGGLVGGTMPLLQFRRCSACAGGLAVDPVGELGLLFRGETLAVLNAELSLADPLAGNWRTGERNLALLSNPPSGRRSPAQLMPFTNAELLTRYMDGTIGQYPSLNPIDFSPAPPTAVVPVSGTNLQEQGVDEADLIKSDGRFVFAISPRWIYPTGEQYERLRVFELDPDSPALVPVAEVGIDTGSRPAHSMFLVTGRPDDRPDLLVVIAGMRSYYDPFTWFSPVPWYDGETRLLVFDVSDRSRPELTHDIEVDGGGADVRRIDETLYVVTRFIPRPWIENAKLLPRLTVNGFDRGLLTDPARVYLSAQSPDYPFSDLTSLTAFDLGALDADPQSISLVGFPEALYVSPDNAFVATSRSAYRLDPQFDELYYPNEVFTDVHQIAFVDGTVEYAGTGSVPGYLPHSGVGPSFAFSEHEGHLRVVSSSGWMFDGPDHRVSVLALAGADADTLPVVGFVPNAGRPEPFGKPGELLYGLRFLGDRLYAVTFKNIDPLYVIDLSDPRDPYLMGALEIPGYSDYLHPLPNDLVLGFGKNAVPADELGDGNFAWYQGLQLSLFDVADPVRPRLVRRIDLGRRGSESSLLWDHHAFAYLPPDMDSGRAARVTIPVVIHDAKTPADVRPDPTHFYDWRYTALAMFDVLGPEGSAPELTLAGVLISHRVETDPDHRSWEDSGPSSGRGLIGERHAYFYLNGVLYSSAWGDGSVVLGPY